MYPQINWKKLDAHPMYHNHSKNNAVHIHYFVEVRYVILFGTFLQDRVVQKLNSTGGSGFYFFKDDYFVCSDLEEWG